MNKKMVELPEEKTSEIVKKRKQWKLIKFFMSQCNL